MNLISRTLLRLTGHDSTPIQSLDELRTRVAEAPSTAALRTLLVRLPVKNGLSLRRAGAEIVATNASEIDGPLAKQLIHWNENTIHAIANHENATPEATDVVLEYLLKPSIESSGQKRAPMDASVQASSVIATLARRGRLAWDHPVMRRQRQTFEALPSHAHSRLVVLAHPETPLQMLREALPSLGNDGAAIDLWERLCERGTVEDLHEHWFSLMQLDPATAVRTLGRMPKERRDLLASSDLLPLYGSADPDIRMAVLRISGAPGPVPDALPSRAGLPRATDWLKIEAPARAPGGRSR